MNEPPVMQSTITGANACEKGMTAKVAQME